MTQIATVEKILPGGMAEISVRASPPAATTVKSVRAAAYRVQVCALSRATTPEPKWDKRSWSRAARRICSA